MNERGSKTNSHSNRGAIVYSTYPVYHIYLIHMGPFLYTGASGRGISRPSGAPASFFFASCPCRFAPNVSFANLPRRIWISLFRVRGGVACPNCWLSFRVSIGLQALVFSVCAAVSIV